MDTGAWLAVIGGGALAGLAIWALVEAHNNNNDVDSLKSQVTNLNNTITSNQTSNAAALKALAQAEAVQANLVAQQAALAQVTANAQAALDALVAAGQGSTTQAAALRTAIGTVSNPPAASASVPV
jgi:hypothetical protein